MVLRELALDSITGDLRLDGGDLVLLSGAEAVAQRVRTHLRTFLGEWVFDTGVGVPWFQTILAGAVDEALIQQILTGAILDVDGVDSIASMKVAIDTATRQLTVSGTIVSENDEPVVISEVLEL